MNGPYMKHRRKRQSSILSFHVKRSSSFKVVLVFAFAALLVFPVCAFASEGEDNNPFAGAAHAVMSFFGLEDSLDNSASSESKVADPSTANTYINVDNAGLGADASTRYNGRIWVDKSVNTQDVTYVDGKSAFSLNKDNGDDFLVTYSALGTATRETFEVSTPIDTAIAIDLSPKCNDSLDKTAENPTGDGKLQTMLTATQDAINDLMEAGDNNRVTLVGFSNQARVLLKLGHYEPGSIKLEVAAGESGDNAPEKQRSVVVKVNDEVVDTFPVAQLAGSNVNKYTQMGGLYRPERIASSANERFDG